MAAPMYDLQHDYLGYHNIPSSCRARIYPTGGKIVAIVSGGDDNRGTSVTNRSEAIATDFVRMFQIRPSDLVMIEHYPPSVFRDGQHTYDLVTYGSWGGYAGPDAGFRNPSWKRLTRDELEAMLGGVPDELERGEHAATL